MQSYPKTTISQEVTPEPYSQDSEQWIIGALANDAATVMPRLKKAGVTRLWFHDLRHQNLFALIEGLYRQARPIDPVAINRRAVEGGEQIGGTDYLAECYTRFESIENYDSHFNEVKRYWTIRRMDSEFADVLEKMKEKPGFDGVGYCRDFLSNFDTPADDLPEIISASELCSRDLPQPPELVAGLLHTGSKLSLGGGSKSFKTWSLLDLAISVATGMPWLGFQTASGKVLYLNFEIQESFFKDRLNAIATAKGVKDLENLHVWNLRGRGADYQRLIPQIIERVKNCRYSLIIFDPIYKMYGATDENSAGDVANLLNALESLAVESGAAIAYGAHFSKGSQAGKDSIDRVSGSGVFARDPDTILTLTRHEEEGAFTLEATLRNFKPIEPFVVRWQHPLMQPDATLDPAALKQPHQKKRGTENHELLALLPVGGWTATEWEQSALEKFHMKRRTFFNRIKEMMQAKQIKVSQGKRYVRT